MGQKLTLGLEANSPVHDCLAQLARPEWVVSDWKAIFSSCCDERGIMRISAAPRFFKKIFKYLELPGNLQQFITTMINWLYVQKKSAFDWNDVLALRIELRAESGLSSPSPPAENLNSEMVKFSEIYENCLNSKELITRLLDEMPLGQTRQDGGLKEAFIATFDTLSALYELDRPKWNEIKQRAYISFVKKRPTTNTSVTSGIAVSALAPGETIGILNCGTGPMKFQFYKVDELGVARVLVDYTPPEEQDLYISGVLDEKKREIFIRGVGINLKHLLTKTPVRTIAIITGKLREAWAQADAYKRRSMETVVGDLFARLNVLPWTSLVCGERACFFLPQEREGRFEVIACGNLLRDLDQRYDVLITCGIGRGTCQWSNRLSTVGHGFGMDAPNKLAGDSVSLKQTVVAAFTPEYIDGLYDMCTDFENPVIALKSGCLLILERSMELRHIICEKRPHVPSHFDRFGRGQNLFCKVNGSFRYVEVLNSQAGKCVVYDYEEQKTTSVYVDVCFSKAPLITYSPSRTITKEDEIMISSLRKQHAQQQQGAGYFAWITETTMPPNPFFLSDGTWMSVYTCHALYEGEQVGVFYCFNPAEKDTQGALNEDRLFWEGRVSKGEILATDFRKDILYPSNVQFELSSFSPPLFCRPKHTSILCLPMNCTLDFGDFKATLDGLSEGHGEYIWRPLFINKPSFLWPSNDRPVHARHALVFSYKPNTKLVICDAQQMWVDAIVLESLGASVHRLNMGSSQVCLELTAANHTYVTFGSVADIVLHHSRYRFALHKDYEFVEDAISGNRLNTDDQLIGLDIVGLEEKGHTSAISDIRTLIKHLLSKPDARVVILAKAGTGKTFSIRQFMRFASVQCEGLVPILIVVQRLANYIRKSPAESVAICSHSIVEFYLRQECVKQTQLQFLLQSLRMRRAIIAIDGIDEAADFKVQLLQWISEQTDHRMVVTSRPEGIETGAKDKLRQLKFDLVTLRELSPRQQHQAIELQLKDNAYYNHLVAFSRSRTAQDNLYNSFGAEDRKRVEGIKPIDLTQKHSIIRQGNVKGEVLAWHIGAARAKALQRPNEQLLLALSHKLQQPKDALWSQIVAATDELYVAAETVLDVVKTWLSGFCDSMSVRKDCLQFSSSLKDPVRTYEKAFDDYKSGCDDSVPPTACVMDIIRCTILDCALSNIAPNLIEKCPPGISVVRVKNKCHPAGVDAAHLRNIFMNLMIRLCLKCNQIVAGACCGSVLYHIFEIQIYHERVYHLSKELRQHDHYEALRAMMKEDAMRKQVNFVLDEQMTLFDTVGRVPVLLSLVVLVLGQDHSLPTTVFDLYRIAIKSMISRFATRAQSGNTNTWEYRLYQLLRWVAFTAQKSGVAAITEKDLIFMGPVDYALWNEVCGVGDSVKSENLTFSVLKVISQKQEYRFGHLSFQEFLFLDYIRAAEQRPDFLLLFNDAKFENTLRIAFTSFDYTKWLLGGRTEFKLQVDSRQLSLFADLLNSPLIHTATLTLINSNVSTTEFVTTCRQRALSYTVFPVERNLIYVWRNDTVVLNFSKLGLVDSDFAKLLPSLPPGVQRLELGQNQLTSKSLCALSAKLSVECQLQFLGFSANDFDITGVKAFAEMLKMNQTLTAWHLSSKSCSDEAVLATFEKVDGLEYFSGSWLRKKRPESKSMSASSAPSLGRRYQQLCKFFEKTKSIETKMSSWKIRRGPFSEQPQAKLVSNKEEKGDSSGLSRGSRESLHALLGRLRDFELVPTNDEHSHQKLVKDMLLGCAHQLACATPHYGLQFMDLDAQMLCKQVKKVSRLEQQSAKVIGDLWNHPAAKEACSEMYFECWNFSSRLCYLFENALSISRDSFLPSAKDVAFAKVYFQKD